MSQKPEENVVDEEIERRIEELLGKDAVGLVELRRELLRTEVKLRKLATYLVMRRPKLGEEQRAGVRLLN